MGKRYMKYKKILLRAKKKNLKCVDIARVLGLCENELKEKLKGKKPFYIHEADRLFKCLGIESGKEKVKFF